MEVTNKKLSAEDMPSFPIGVDDYKEIIDKNCVYIDKTLLIKEFWKDDAKVILVTRPRRFGKTISLSMLRYFFEKTKDSNRYLFEKSNIWKEEGFPALQGQFPVIFISFKDVKYNTWEKSYAKFKNILNLDISSNALDDSIFGYINKMKNIVYLNVSNNFITTNGINIISDLDSIATIVCKETSVTDLFYNNKIRKKLKDNFLKIILEDE